MVNATFAKIQHFFNDCDIFATLLLGVIFYANNCSVYQSHYTLEGKQGACYIKPEYFTSSLTDKTMLNKKISFFLVLSLALFPLSACSMFKKGEAKYPSGLDRSATGDDIYGEKESIFGADGLAIFGGKKKGADDGSTGIGVNSYLWRASLDTVSFMPLASADPFGGVIITDWYSSPEKPSERFKVNVFILDKQLVSNGVKVKVFRQTQSRGGWIDSTVAENTATQMEDAILTRARQLRVAALEE